MQFTRVSIVLTSLFAMLLPVVAAKAVSSQLEIISISETSDSSVEILFNSSIPKKSLSYYVINVAVDPSVGQPKNINKVIKTKATGLITAEIKNLNPKVAYNFSISAKTNKGKMISSAPVEYSPLSNLMDLLSNLPADWGNPKPIELPTPTPTAAPVAAPAAKVAITQASIGTSPGIAFTTQPQITIQDSSGNTITSSTAVVTATVSDGGTLVGTATATASSGVATFSNLGIRGFNTAYTITYTASGLTPASVSVTPSALTVGNPGPGGGNIFYVAATSAGFTCGPTRNEKCYYLEAAPSGWNTGNDPVKPWAVIAYQSANISGIIDDDTAYNNALGIGLGYANSLAIVAQNGAYNATTNNYAAGAARAYAGGSQNDWYLPTTVELNQMCKWQKGNTGLDLTNLATVCTGGTTNVGSGASGFSSSSNYWSSSEITSTNAWRQYTLDGRQVSSLKFNSLRVRPVRAF